MIITKKHLARRTFLRGLGTAMALPMLDSMVPALAAPARNGGATPARMAFLYVPNGVIMKDWMPATEGKGYEFPRTLKPIEDFRNEMLLLSGLDHHNGAALGDGPGDHARAGATWL